METADRPITILMADDDADDQLMAREALDEARVKANLVYVQDGEDLLDYLNRRGRYRDPVRSPRPGLILLDLNMPKKDGREALKEIKSDPALRSIPVVVLTTSRADEDVYRTYDLGGNSFVTKPTSFDDLVGIMRTLVKYWFEIAALPAGDQDAEGMPKR
jgi:CheY-like chemotaxis protein